MADKKRIVKSNKTREDKIREALTNRVSAPFVNAHGMTSQQIRKALNQNKKTASKNIVRQSIKRHPANKPQKVEKPKHSPNPRLLLDAPNATTRLAVEHPSPSWFRCDEPEVDVSVIIPIYKSNEVLSDLIESWQINNSGLIVESIFVDDNCPRNSKEIVVKEWIKRRRELVDHNCKVGRIYFSPQNMGFGMTCNTGAEYARGKYLIFLNADTKVTHNWIKPIIRLLRKDDVGIVGNMQIKEGGKWDMTIDGAGSEWSWEHQIFDHIGRHSYNHSRITRPFHISNCPADLMEVAEREMVTGCCLAIRKDLFLDIGGFNPNYMIGYWEDSELCMTVREKGYKIMYQPNSRIYHKLGHSESAGHKYDTHNRNYFFNKWVNSGRIDSLVNVEREKKPNVSSILLRRRAAHGDVLIAAAVAPALKKKHPNCKIMFNTDCEEVLENNPWIDQIVKTEEISERSFKVYYNLDMAYEYRPHTNILDAYAELVGVKREDCQLHVKTEAMPTDIPEKYVVIHAGKTSWVGRDWSTFKFDIIAKRIQSEGWGVVLVGRSADAEISCDIDLRNKTNISQLAHVIKNSKLFVGIDSFPMHIAQSFDMPGVCFFGSILPELRIYSSNMKGVSAKSLACIGCHHKKPTPCVVTDSCETGTLDCVNLVSVDNMWKEVKIALERNGS
jgi:GT2 family glycosyltransferase/ADP-heptose:LPS heptosyltransferase